jgi:hypothetical protein
MIGTLIDFEGGILDWMRPRILRTRPDLGDTAILETYARVQSAVRKAQPGLLFSARLPKIWDGVAAESQYHDIGVARRMGLATCWIYRRHGQPGYGGTQVPDEFTAPDFLAVGLDDLVRQYELALLA